MIFDAIKSGRPFRRTTSNKSATWYRYDTEENEIYNIQDASQSLAMINVEDAVEPNWEIRMSDTFQRGEVEHMLRQAVGQALFQFDKDPNSSSGLRHDRAVKIAKDIMGQY